MTENKEIMARNIKFYMEQKKVSATEICSKLGIKQNTFSDWVNAKSYPRIDKIQKMADYFGISKSFLVEDIVPVTHFTSEEVDMIVSYRNSDDDTRRMIKRLLAYNSLIGKGDTE